MSVNPPHERCRIVLALSTKRNISPEQMADILKTGDVASLILYSEDENETAFQKYAEALVPVIQNAGVAAIIAGDSRIAGRVKADGFHVESNIEDLKEAIEKHQTSMMVGFANLRDRHSAMQIGELEPDYMMFGKLGADKKPEAHSRNISLGEWWVSMMEVPALIQAGNSLASIETIAKTGAEFIVLEEAIFGTSDMVANIIAANELLDEHTPKLGDNDE